MQTQPEIASISRTGPPSYTETMSSTANLKDNAQIPPTSQQTYQQFPQAPPYPPPLPGYQNNSFYPVSGENIHTANLPYTLPINNSQPQVTPVPVTVRAQHVIYAGPPGGRSCIGRFFFIFVCIMSIIIMIRVFIMMLDM